MSPTADDYARIFEAERQVRYDVIDAIEAREAFALDRQRLEDAARVLACPFKAHAPNWQHGRVLYALLRGYLAARASTEPVHVVDVGTAKGFSALCMQWALNDSRSVGDVTSVDVLDPEAAVRRNTVAELGGYLTLRQTLDPWPDAAAIRFLKATGESAIRAMSRVHFCYLDGKHTFDAVSEEIALLLQRQEPGDVVVFDDVQIDGVARAVKAAAGYVRTCYEILPHRRFAIGVRRG